jgi:pre-mRNA-splicing factor 38B
MKIEEDKRFNVRKNETTSVSIPVKNEENTWNNINKQFKIYGDGVTCNLNSLLHNNILSCQYFKDQLMNLGFNEIIDIIIQHVKYAEPWTIGTNGIPSTLFCCLYKFMIMRLSEQQVKFLINNQDSPYVRCSGFLYIRYLCDPNDLWSWMSPYLLDDKRNHL